MKVQTLPWFISNSNNWSRHFEHGFFVFHVTRKRIVDFSLKFYESIRFMTQKLLYLLSDVLEL